MEAKRGQANADVLNEGGERWEGLRNSARESGWRSQLEMRNQKEKKEKEACCVDGGEKLSEGCLCLSTSGVVVGGGSGKGTRAIVVHFYESAL